MGKKEKIKNIIGTIYSWVMFLFTPFFFISCGTIIPCTFRPFYYWSVGPLGIESSSGYSYNTIKTAFDDVMNFIWRGAPFKTGSLAFTAEEEAHFADCIPLFRLQLILFIVGAVLFLTYYILTWTKVLPSKRYKNLSPVTYGAMLTLTLMAVIGIWAAISFDGLFQVFHQVFFPGKSNWTFDPNTEEIIKILPESFFLECAIFIISVVVILCAVSITLGFVFRHKREKALRA